MPLRPHWLIALSLVGLAARMSWTAENTLPELSSAVVRAIAFDGNTAIDSASLANRLSIRPGSAFDPQQIKFSRDVIASIYQDKGYADVKVSTHVVVSTKPLTPTLSPMGGEGTRNHQVDIQFQIEEGPIYHVRAIHVQGNHLIPDKLIQRDLGIKPGEPFSQSKIYEGNKRLFLSGYFETIDIHDSSAPVHLMDIQVQVKERATKYLKGGFGYGTETKERLSLGYDDRNFFGNEKQLDVTAVYSGFLTDPQKYRTAIVETSLAQPHFLNTSFQGQTSLSEEWDDRLPYDSRTTAWRSSLGRRFGDHLTLSLQYRFQGTELTRIDPSQASTTLPFTDVSAFGPSFTYDNTNDPFLPSDGWRIFGHVEKGMELVYGNNAFQRYEFRVGRFDTFFHAWTFFVGLQTALVRPDYPNDSIPIFERYTLGGAGTVRGYQEEDLGPTDAEGNPLGGNAYGVGNLEIRHKLYKQLWGEWFLDGGQLYQEPLGHPWPYIQAKSIGDFAYGTGPGLRLHTPVGAVRLEAGYRLNPPGGGRFLKRIAVDFSLGEVF